MPLHLCVLKGSGFSGVKQLNYEETPIINKVKLKVYQFDYLNKLSSILTSTLELLTLIKPYSHNNKMIKLGQKINLKYIEQY